jgi:hypothetical protein
MSTVRASFRRVSAMSRARAESMILHFRLRGLMP